MIQRILNSKNFLAVLLAMTTGTLLYFKMPWPMTMATCPQTWNEYFLRIIAMRDPWSYAALKASYRIMLVYDALYRILILAVGSVYLHASALACRGSRRPFHLTPRLKCARASIWSGRDPQSPQPHTQQSNRDG